MARTLSMLKPDVKTLILNNEIKEKVTYLDIEENMGLFCLQNDVKKGAVQFRELEKLVEKNNEAKYILITTDSKEFGYMAVSYLAAAFNEKNGYFSKDEMLEEIPEEWEESIWRIPVVTENELRQYIGNGNEGFSNGSFYTMGNHRTFLTNPYWMDCRSKSVCIFSNDYSCGFGFGAQNREALYDGLEFFKKNEKVYIINLISRIHWNNDWEGDWEESDTQETDEENYSYDYNRSKWNHIILSFAADEAEVLLPKKQEKIYYKEILRGIFYEKGIKAVRGFSYEKVLNLFLDMQEEAKCQLLENIVNYAVKDWEDDHPEVIKVEDFAFMDRFVRTKSMVSGNKNNAFEIPAKEQLLNHLIGMEQVKEQVMNVVNVMKFNRMRAQMHISGGSYHNVHVMLGAPGTAKTTVAQLMGQMMVEEKLLPDNRFTCVNGAELKGMYVGHSAPKTKALFEENDIIVIDEAYSLVSDSGQNDSFSKEAIAQLIIELENHSMDKLVIFAGYGGEKVSEKNNKMKAFLDANPGIKSRITSTIYFDSYSPEEMISIFFQIAKNQNYVVDENVKDMLYRHFEKRVGADNFGNGREARSLLETSVIFAAKRLFSENKTKYKKADMQNLIYDDVRQAIAYSEKADVVQRGTESKKIGF